MERKKIIILEVSCVITIIIGIFDFSIIEIIIGSLTLFGIYKKYPVFLKLLIIPLLFETIEYTINFITFLTATTIYYIIEHDKKYGERYYLAKIIKIILQFIVQTFLTIELYILLKNPIAFENISNSNAEVVYTSDNELERENSLPSYSPPNPLPPYSPPETNIDTSYIQPPVSQINENPIMPPPVLTPYPLQSDNASIIITPTRREPDPPTLENNSNTNNVLPDHSISMINQDSTYLANIPNLTNLEVLSTTDANTSVPTYITTPYNQNNSNNDSSSSIQHTSTSNLINIRDSNSSVDIVNVENRRNNTQNNDIPTQPPPPYSLY